MKKILCIVGPTGTGKSDTAIRLARKFAGRMACRIVNADSRQIYRDFPIITAQPSASDRAVCPHLLYGFLESTERMSAGEWSDLARQTFAASSENAPPPDLPIVVGGTGFYLRALFDGIVDIPAIPDALTSSLMADFLAGQGPALYRRLQEIDPSYAARIHPNDRQRLVRALAVQEVTGHTFTWWHERTPAPEPFDILRIGICLPLDELTPFLNRRIDRMLTAGALDEARTAWEKCPDSDAPGWSGIGCREVLQYLQGALSLDAACGLWRKNTRAYAKRQLTWFRADNRILWFRPEETDAIDTRAAAWLDARPKKRA